MALDVVAAILVLLALLRGWVRGFVFQLGQVAVLGVGFMAGRLFGGTVARWIPDLQTSLPQAADAVGFFLVFAIVYALGALVLHGLTRDLRASPGVLATSDRFLGLVVGGAKGAVLIYLGFLVLVMASRWDGKLGVPYASSWTGRLVAQHNLFDSEEFPRARALAKLGWLLSTHDAGELVQNPHFVAILVHPKSQVLREPDVLAALNQGDWMHIMGHQGIWDLLDEPEIQEHLNAVEYAERGGTEPGLQPVGAPSAAVPVVLPLP